MATEQLPWGLTRRPQTHDELWELVALLWGVEVPRTQVCPDHVAPFTAFANAFFAETPVAIWKASRGFGGKSFTLALLAATEAVLLGAETTILGGSASQSLNVHEHTATLWRHAHAPRALLAGEPTRWDTWLTNGAHLRALTASQRSVRGPHPQRLRMDEIDEMDLAILEAAQGQPMSKVLPHVGLVPVHTVMSSTHQYPDKTMSEMLMRAHQKGWPVFQWCFRETSNPVDGWLRPLDVDTKRAEVGERMWQVEFDLQEPSIEGRAVDTASVERYFDPAIGMFEDTPGKALIFHEPLGQRRYVTGVDWAKEHDWTVIDTFDATVRPWQRVAWERVQRLPWPVMVQKVVDRLEQFPGVLAHDATGLGGVLRDLLDSVRLRHPVKDVVMAGRSREVLFNEYIAAIESDELRSPRIPWAFDEHRYVTMPDLFSGYGTKGHPPDSFVAGALAWSQRNARRDVVTPVSLTKASHWRLPSL